MTSETGKTQQTLMSRPGVKTKCIINLHYIWGFMVVLSKFLKGLSQDELQNSTLLVCFKPTFGNF